MEKRSTVASCSIKWVSRSHPAKTAEVPIKFLMPDLIKPRLQAGARFTLWEGKDFADGEVL